jgi:ribosomal protein S18 acetylase RimI-like enzyme
MINVEVTPVETITSEVAEACQRLIPQLSTTSSPPTMLELQEVIDNQATVLFAGRIDGLIVGLLTLTVFRIPTGIRAWIEDVVVDDSSRGKGVGAALTRAALDVAMQKGAKSVDLTSRPSRKAANRLYLQLGFIRRETNIYRYKL